MLLHNLPGKSPVESTDERKHRQKYQELSMVSFESPRVQGLLAIIWAVCHFVEGIDERTASNAGVAVCSIHSNIDIIQYVAVHSASLVLTPIDKWPSLLAQTSASMNVGEPLEEFIVPGKYSNDLMPAGSY